MSSPTGANNANGRSPMEEDDLAADLSGSKASIKGSSGLHHHAEKSAGHHYPHQKKNGPDTVAGGEGSAKRNIVRKGRDQAKDKKQGGGHKGQWVATDDGTQAASSGALDRDDPNYDSEEDPDVVLVSGDGKGGSSGRRAIVAPVMQLAEFKARAADALKEFFVSEEMGEMRRSVEELNCPVYHYELVKRAISMSLDQKEREREMVSRLLSDLYPDLLTTDDVEKGFERLFETVDDLALDAPSAVRDIAAFLARAVVDEILPPSFLSDPLIVGLGGPIVEHAKLLLSRDHMGARLEHIWGPGDGRPVAELKVAIDQLVQEYLLSRQLEEAARCVRELSCPHFHHEVVKRAVATALDSTKDEDRQAVASLLAYLYANEVISGQQLRKGFTRLHQLLPDLSLDVPNARPLLDAMVHQAQSDGCLPADFAPIDVAALGGAPAATNGSSSA